VSDEQTWDVNIPTSKDAEIERLYDTIARLTGRAEAAEARIKELEALTGITPEELRDNEANQQRLHKAANEWKQRAEAAEALTERWRKDAEDAQCNLTEVRALGGKYLQKYEVERTRMAELQAHVNAAVQRAEAAEAALHLEQVAHAVARKNIDYKDRAFVQLGDTAGRAEADRDEWKQRAEKAEKENAELRTKLHRYIADASSGYEYKIMVTERLEDYMAYRASCRDTPLSLEDWWRSPLSIRA
jgi:chromosome segregation ATPase